MLLQLALSEMNIHLIMTLTLQFTTTISKLKNPSIQRTSPTYPSFNLFSNNLNNPLCSTLVVQRMNHPSPHQQLNSLNSSTTTLPPPSAVTVHLIEVLAALVSVVANTPSSLSSKTTCVVTGIVNKPNKTGR